MRFQVAQRGGKREKGRNWIEGFWDSDQGGRRERANVCKNNTVWYGRYGRYGYFDTGDSPQWPVIEEDLTTTEARWTILPAAKW